jgi:hypothetical protein
MCLDVSSGGVYISRDVVFDETVFPFSKMDANAGARLRTEINLLHPTLVSTYQGCSIAESSAANMSNNAHEIARSEISSAPAPNNEDVADLSSEQLAPNTANLGGGSQEEAPASIPPGVQQPTACAI